MRGPAWSGASVWRFLCMPSATQGSVWPLPDGHSGVNASEELKRDAALQHALVAVGAIVTFAYGQLLPHLFAGRMPQVPGENVVAMLLGDARQGDQFRLARKGRRLFSRRGAPCGVRPQPVQRIPKESEHHSPQRADTRMHTATITTTITLNMMRRLRRSIPGGGSIAACMCRSIATPKAKTHAGLVPWLWAACRTSPRNIPDS